MLAELIDARARRQEPQSRRGGLACTPTLARVGLARPPIPRRGLARGQSVRGGALAPPCASHGDRARPTALPGLPPAGRRRRVVNAFRETFGGMRARGLSVAVACLLLQACSGSGSDASRAGGPAEWSGSKPAVAGPPDSGRR